MAAGADMIKQLLEAEQTAKACIVLARKTRSDTLKQASGEADVKLGMYEDELIGKFEIEEGFRKHQQSTVNYIVRKLKEDAKSSASDDGGVGDAVGEVDGDAMTLEDCKKKLEEAQKKLKEASSDKEKKARERAEAQKKHAEEAAAKHKAAQEEYEKAKKEAEEEQKELDERVQDLKDAQNYDGKEVRYTEDAKKRLQDSKDSEDDLKKKELEAREKLHDLRNQQLKDHGGISRVSDDDDAPAGCSCPSTQGGSSSRSGAGGAADDAGAG